MVTQAQSPTGGPCKWRSLVCQTPLSAVSPTSVSRSHPPRAYVPGRVIHTFGFSDNTCMGLSVPRNVSRPAYCDGKMSLKKATLNDAMQNEYAPRKGRLTGRMSVIRYLDPT